MPADRFLHKRAGQGERSGSLSHLEWRIWTAYFFAADDFGVMWDDPAALIPAMPKLAEEPRRRLRNALDTLHRVGLARRFNHQGRAFLYQPDWQDFQKIDWPQLTLNPRPTDDLIAACTPATRRLFLAWPGKQRVPSEPKEPREIREDVGTASGEPPERIPTDSPDRAFYRLGLEASGNGSGKGSREVDGRAEWFWNHWREAESSATGLMSPLTPRPVDFPKILDALERVKGLSDERVVAAIGRFWALDSGEQQAWNVKQKTIGYFAMALPRLLEPPSPVGASARTAGNAAALRGFVESVQKGTS